MRSRLILTFLTLLLTASKLFGQSPIRVTAQVGTLAFPVAEGGSVPIPSDGRDTNVSFIIANVSNANVQLDGVSVAGTGWTIVSQPALPLTLPPGTSASFIARFSPAGTNSLSAQLAIQTRQASQSRTFNAVLTGSVPEFVYFLDTATGRTQVASGARIPFGLIKQGTRQTFSLTVNNRGNAPGTISSIGLTGRDFTTSATAPVTVQPGQEVTIPITFNPQQRGVSSGALTLGAGTNLVSFNIDGTGAAAELVVSYSLRSNGNVQFLANGGRLVFPSTAATTTALADVIISNQGNAAGVVRSVAVSAAAFQLGSLPLLPATLEPGQSIRFVVIFNPRELGSYTGSLRIELEDRTIAATLEGDTSNPNFSLAYIDPVTKNTTPVGRDGVITFPATDITSATIYTLVLRNQGPGTGFVNSVGVFGNTFQLTDVPLLPATVEAGSELRFNVRFAPRQREQESGTLTIGVTPTSTLTYQLSGSGVGGQFVYETATENEPLVAAAAGGELTFNALAGQTVTRTVRFTNVGNSEAEVAGITVSGSGFRLVNLPFLPVQVPVNGSQTFSVSFTPDQPGITRGRLRIGDQVFDLTGNSIAPRLQYSYSNEAGSISVAENGTLVFPAARVGESSRGEFTIRNTGTSAATVSSIDINPVNAVFQFVQQPPVPFRLEPGDTANVGLRFTPNNTGAVTASLRVNNSSFVLSGSGQQPVALPEPRITGPSGPQEPLRQPSVGLSLQAPYPLPVRGVLRLSFLSDVFTENPAVQFASGGRAVGFTIPANAVEAVFENGSTEMKLQTGSVAGSIQLTPSFTTTAGLDLTPTNPGTLTMTIGRSAPRLTAIDVVTRTATNLVLVVTGISTSRTLRTLQIQLTPREGAELTIRSMTVNVEPAAVAWFQTTESQNFGGLFSITIPLVLSRGNSTEDLVSRIQSVSVSATNDVGVSNSVDLTP